ncbi:hypothetical protein Aduo_008315 [Ancylostoma duodenale]
MSQDIVIPDFPHWAKLPTTTAANPLAPPVIWLTVALISFPRSLYCWRWHQWPEDEKWSQKRHAISAKEDVVREVECAAKKGRNHNKEKLNCDVCGKSYLSQGGLRKHIRMVHKGEEKAPISTGTDPRGEHSVACPECAQGFHSNFELAVHCEIDHNDGTSNFGILGTKFSSWVDFETWMEEKEKETFSRLVRRCVIKCSGWNTYTYTCQHARGEGESVDPKQRKERYRKSKRVHKHCSCFAKRLERVEVTACFRHVGHEINTASAPLSNEDIMVVKSVILKAFPIQRYGCRTLDKLRTGHWIAEEALERQPRICFVTMRDISNIAARHGLIDGRSSADDGASLRALVEDEENIAAVKLIETMDLRGDGFLLAFVTHDGKKYLERYGNRGLVFDDTFNVTRYCFRRATLVVSDGGGNGFPCSHLLSFRMETAKVKALFELVKGCVPNFDLKCDEGRYVRFLQRVQGSVPVEQGDQGTVLVPCEPNFAEEAQRIFEVAANGDCTLEVRVEFRCLYHLAHFGRGQEDVRACGEELFREERRMGPMLPHKSAVQHLQACGVLAQQAQSHSFAQQAKREAGQVTYALIKHSYDCDLQLTSASGRGGSDISGRRKQNVRKHKDALAYYEKIASIITQSGDNCWKAPSKSQAGVKYDVVIDDTLCDCDSEVNSHCERCGICSYQVSCNCPSAYQAGVSCVHAHVAATFVTEASRLLRPVRHRLASDSSCSSPATSRSGETAMICDSFPRERFFIEIEPNTEPDHVAEVPDDVIAEYRKKRSAAKIAQLSEMLHALVREQEYDVVKECGKAIDNTLQLAPSDLMKRRPFARRLDMQTTGMGPKPAGIQPQYKTVEFLLKREKRRERKFINDDSDVENEAHRILQTDRKQLKICFVCG